MYFPLYGLTWLLQLLPLHHLPVSANNKGEEKGTPPHLNTFWKSYMNFCLYLIGQNIVTQTMGAPSTLQHRCSPQSEACLLWSSLHLS